MAEIDTSAEGVAAIAYAVEQPHEWGYRDCADGTFISDPRPFDAAALIRALAAERDEARAALRGLMAELPWVNEHLDMMPDDYAEAQEAARRALSTEAGDGR